MAKLKFAFPIGRPNDTEYAVSTDAINDETIGKSQDQINQLLELVAELNQKIVPSVYLSEAEYNALSEEEKNKNIEYNIY